MSVQNRLNRVLPSIRDLRELSVQDIVTYGVYVLALIFFLFPVFWVFSMSIRPESELLTYPVQLLPQEWTFDAYVQVMNNSDMPTWLFNSTKIAVLEVLGILFVTVPSAYAFSRFDFRGRKMLLLGVLLFQMISPVVIVIPMYNLMNQLNLLNSHIGIILLYIGLQTPFSIWLLKSYFDTIPQDLDKAARVDGCNRLQTMRHVLLPSLLPGMAVVAIFNFVFAWAEFVMAFTLLRDSSLYTASIGIFSFQGQYSSDWGLIAAGSIVVMTPMVLMFIFFQRYFVKGLVEGAVKG